MPNFYYNEEILEEDVFAGENMTEWRRKIMAIEEAV